MFQAFLHYLSSTAPHLPGKFSAGRLPARSYGSDGAREAENRIERRAPGEPAGSPNPRRGLFPAEMERQGRVTSRRTSRIWRQVNSAPSGRASEHTPRRCAYRNINLGSVVVGCTILLPYSFYFKLKGSNFNLSTLALLGPGAADSRRQQCDDNVQDRCLKLDTSGNGYIDLKELKDALDGVGYKIPQWKVRCMIEEYYDEGSKRGRGAVNGSVNGDARRNGISLAEFEELCAQLKAQQVCAAHAIHFFYVVYYRYEICPEDQLKLAVAMFQVSSTFKQAVSKKENLEHLGGMSEASSDGTTHSVRLEEQMAFSGWINSNLEHDPDLKHLLPIDPEGKQLYEKLKDGLILCKVINHSCPETIDERAINKKNLTLYTKHENLTLALVSSQAIGCNIVNIDAHDLAKGKPHLVLGLLWQIIRIGLFNQITLEHCPGLTELLNDQERIEDLLRLSPEAILLRWVNHQLQCAGVTRRCTNFQQDVSDSEIYSYLLKQIAPADAGVNVDALREPDLLRRAELMLQQAAKLRCRAFVTPADVVGGVYKLNLAFVANLFNQHPGLERAADAGDQYEQIEETREEKTYRNWMNSMGVAPHVNWLYSDLTDGLVIFQLYDIIRPGIVNWKKVHRQFSKLRKFMERLENCNYAVELGRQLGFSLVGIAGADINEGNATLTLGQCSRLMLDMSKPIVPQSL
ncbi:Plastin-2 [Eumeta japonica]|uniref:Plastin-2 n=1 Tax=Eumeta variegata TaxID=151549 RepID=A0A4C1URQ1_EUMVA|nr:Plastin-2 [Eumeta japonica]